MRNVVLALTVILAMSVLLAIPAQADVMNIILSSVGASGAPGTATVLSGAVSGTNPYTNLEVNIKMSQSPPAGMVYEGWAIDSKTKAGSALGAFSGDTLSMRTAAIGTMGKMAYDVLAVSIESANTASAIPTTIVARGTFASGTPVTAADFPTSAVFPPNEMFDRQLAMQHFNLTTDQVSNLRMQGWGYDDIMLMANAASRCKKSVTDIAGMVSSGQTWDQIATACNTTVASLMTLTPMQAVAGYQGQITPGAMPMVQPFMYYRMYPSGVPVITRDVWNQYSARGFTWMDVAVAANISSVTGDNIDNLLRWVFVSGMTWSNIAVERGLDINQVMDVSGWPFSKNGGEETTLEEHHIQTEPGAGPTY